MKRQPGTATSPVPAAEPVALYALLLAEAQREDLERFVHRDSLVRMWPRLRRLLGPHARRE